VVTRATKAIGDLPIPRAVSTPLAADEPRNPLILWQAGVLLAVTGAVGSLCYAACAISDRMVAVWIRPSPAVVVAKAAARTKGTYLQAHSLSCADGAVSPPRSALSGTTSSSLPTTSSATKSHSASSAPTGNASATPSNTEPADSRLSLGGEGIGGLDLCRARISHRCR
jgi:hypothetical protein